MVSFAEAFAGRKMSKAAVGNARSAGRGPHREAGGSLAGLSDAEVDRRMGQQLPQGYGCRGADAGVARHDAEPRLGRGPARAVGAQHLVEALRPVRRLEVPEAIQRILGAPQLLVFIDLVLGILLVVGERQASRPLPGGVRDTKITELLWNANEALAIRSVRQINSQPRQVLTDFP